MKETPIIFSGEMVTAILEGRKTQTRRVVVPEMHHEVYGPIAARGFYQRDRYMRWHGPFTHDRFLTRCPYGGPGDRLWVREAWGIASSGGYLVDPCVNYRADGKQRCIDPQVLIDGGYRHREGWRSARFMYKWAARISLEIDQVRIERVQEITSGGYVMESDVQKEGCPFETDYCSFGQKELDWFVDTWGRINGKRGYSWEANPWVWMIEFKPDGNNPGPKVEK